MEILKGIVGPYKDPTESGRMNVLFKGRKGYVEVIYTSPYFARYYHGVFAPPAEHSEILAFYDGTNYYYLSTVVNHSEFMGQTATEEDGSPAKLSSEYNAYTPSGNPAVMTFKNEQDAGMKISNYYYKASPPSTETKIVSNVSIKSSTNNRLILGDGPDLDCVMLKNKHGDGLTIGSTLTGFAPLKNVPYSERSVVINTLNSQTCVVENGEYQIRVNEGRDITVRNDSKGLYGFYIPDPTVIGAINPALMYGNINLISKWRDINIFTDNPVPLPNSNIFISTQGGVVQISSGGGVKIFSNNPGFKVTVQSAGGIDLLSTVGDINIEATTGNVNIKGGINTNVEGAAQLNAYGLGATNLGALTPLTLNSNAPTPVTPVVPSIPQFNVYGK